MFLSSIQGVTFQSMNVHSESYIPPRKWSVQWFEFYSDQLRRSSCSLHVIDAFHFPSHHIITGAWQLDTTYLDSLCLGSRQTLFKLAYCRTLENEVTGDVKNSFLCSAVVGCWCWFSMFMPTPILILFLVGMRFTLRMTKYSHVIPW